jgi:acyl-CoA thioesterase-2
MADPQAAVDGLVQLLDLEQLAPDRYRGRSPRSHWQRVFGGQVAGQALVAAGRTVEPERRVHSLHSYFIRPGDPAIPIVYDVDRVRDGRSFTTRRVVAVQHERPIFTLSASFQLDQPGVDHQSPMPDVPDPEAVPTLDERLAGADEAVGSVYRALPRPIDLRYVDPPPWEQRAHGPRDGLSRVWMRADGVLPDDPLLHVCVLTYASDLTLLGSVLAPHTRHMGQVGLASLDHAMWFHRPFRGDEWLLYECRSPTASGSRGLATGRFFTRDGRLAATAVQEGLVRVPAARS